MQEMTLFHYPEYIYRKKLASDTWRLKDIKSHHPKQLQVVCQKNLTIRSSHRRVEHTQHCESNTNKDAGEDLDTFAYLEYVENITHSQSQPPPSLAWTEIYPGAGARLINFIVEPWEHNVQGCLETNLQNNP